MDIISAEFVKGIIGTDKILYNGKFQIAFFGRSNVGKSSLVNSLVKKSTLARTSSNPGRTVRMDFFLINNSFYFVDFPGYGYARRSPEERNKLAKMMLWYVQYSEVKKRLAILVIDAKVGITVLDAELLKTFRASQIDHIVVANKIDNIPMGQKEKQIEVIKQASQDTEVFPYSSKTKIGRNEVLSKISSYVNPRIRSKAHPFA